MPPRKRRRKTCAHLRIAESQRGYINTRELGFKAPHASDPSVAQPGRVAQRHEAPLSRQGGPPRRLAEVGRFSDKKPRCPSRLRSLNLHQIAPARASEQLGGADHSCLPRIERVSSMRPIAPNLTRSKMPFQKKKRLRNPQPLPRFPHGIGKKRHPPHRRQRRPLSLARCGNFRMSPSSRRVGSRPGSTPRSCFHIP